MTTSRRDFLIQGGLGAALLGLGASSTLSSCKADRIRELGLITGVIRKELQLDWESTLRKVAEIGYRYLEFGNHYGTDPAAFRKFLSETGMRPLAGGTTLSAMKKDDEFKKLIADSLVLGKKYMVCYWPWMDSADNKKLDDFKSASDDMNILGAICQSEGIQFLVHNHNKEFVPVEGFRWGYEVMIENTDPRLVGMELDVYWCAFAGGDSGYLLDKYPKRFKILHLKDMDKSPEKLYTCPGYGVIDFKSVFAKSEKSGVRYYVVEVDENPEPMKCIEDSYEYLMGMRF